MFYFNKEQELATNLIQIFSLNPSDWEATTMVNKLFFLGVTITTQNLIIKLLLTFYTGKIVESMRYVVDVYEHCIMLRVKISQKKNFTP